MKNTIFDILEKVSSYEFIVSENILIKQKLISNINSITYHKDLIYITNYLDEKKINYFVDADLNIIISG